MARVRREAAQTVWRAAIYIRLSREDGNDESYSVTNQRQRLAAYFETLLAGGAMELAGFYIDDGSSGTDSDRESFQRMLADIDAGRVNCVIVKDLSRLSRNDWECKRYLQHLFVVKNVRFISLELPRLDSFKNPDEVYDLGVSIQSMYNENHCRETSIKVRGTFDSKRERGEFIGAFAPFGYSKDPADRHRLIADKEAAPVVRDIFRWFVHEGMSKTGIVKRLTASGVPCPAEYKRQCGLHYQNPHLSDRPVWGVNTVTGILKNRVYLGDMVQGRQKVKSYKVHTRVAVPQEDWFVREGTHEAIVDAALFALAQDLMQRDTRSPPAQGRVYPFSGFLRCADCGKAMVRRSARQQVYYACRTHVTTGLCSRHSIRHDRLEGAVLAALQTQVSLIDNLDALIESIQAAPAAPARRGSPENARRQLERANALRTGLYTDWKNGDITREEYHRMKREFEEKEEKARQALAALEEENASRAKAPPPFDGKLTLDRGTVTQLVRVIRIREGGEITIALAFADPCLS